MDSLPSPDSRHRHLCCVVIRTDKNLNRTTSDTALCRTALTPTPLLKLGDSTGRGTFRNFRLIPAERRFGTLAVKNRLWCDGEYRIVKERSGLPVSEIVGPADTQRHGEAVCSRGLQRRAIHSIHPYSTMRNAASQ